MVNEVSHQIITSIENIVQNEFVKSEVKKDSYQEMMAWYQQSRPASSPSLNLNSSSSSSRMIDEKLPSNYSDTNQQTSKTFSTLQIFVNPKCSKQILQCIAEHSVDYIPPNISKDPIPENLNSQDLVTQLTNRMHEFEQSMHPQPTWKYNRIHPKDENEKFIVKIDYYPDLMPEGKELDLMLEKKAANSLVVRKLSILSGTLTLLDSPSFITANPETKQKIADYIRQESNAIISAPIRKDNTLDIKRILNFLLIN